MGDSPAKMLNLDLAGKENVSMRATVIDDSGIRKPISNTVNVDEKILEKPLAVTVAPGIKPEEANEPLLQENPNRFVLFPIKYHEVRVVLTRHA